MDLTQLEIVRAVATEGSITAAAARLHRVPSNLTTRIKQLEAELGTELFIREKLRLRLSPTGRSFLDYAERILDLVEEARQVAVGAEPHGGFSLGSMESTAAVRIPEMLARYHQNCPKVQLDLSTGPSGEMIDGVLSGRFIAAFADGPANHPQLDGQPVYREELVLMSAKHHAPVHDARDVAGETVFAFRDTCSYRKRLEGWFVRTPGGAGRRSSRWSPTTACSPASRRAAAWRSSRGGCSKAWPAVATWRSTGWRRSMPMRRPGCSGGAAPIRRRCGPLSSYWTRRARKPKRLDFSAETAAVSALQRNVGNTLEFIRKAPLQSLCAALT